VDKLDIQTFYKDKLSAVLFLEVTKEAIKRVFNKNITKNICMPVRAKKIFDQINNGSDFESIPVDLLIEGMVYVIGADPKFVYNPEYKDIVSGIEKSSDFIKGRIYAEVTNENYEDAYILIKGLLEIEPDTSVFDKAIIIIENLRKKDSMFKSEELELLQSAEEISGYSRPFLYEGIIHYENGDYEIALNCLNDYLARGGEETAEVAELKCSLQSTINYEKGKEFVYTEPDRALKYLLPLMDEFGDKASLFYHIAVCYRQLQNYEKGIYYLNEALSIDPDLVEAYNEIGIDYASLGNFKNAVDYLRKAFEVTKNVEICTNLIMCYINMGDMEQAKNHLEIAKKLNSQDEIVIKLDNILNNIDK
jgi:tetratricopeptide (TPR) repeat protein